MEPFIIEPVEPVEPVIIEPVEPVINEIVESVIIETVEPVIIYPFQSLIIEPVEPVIIDNIKIPLTVQPINKTLSDYTFIEPYDIEKLNKIIYNINLFEPEESKQENILNGLNSIKEKLINNELLIKYSKNLNFGRMYANGGYNYLKKNIRTALTEDIFIDIDNR